jgi:hypothetical protein
MRRLLIYTSLFALSLGALAVVAIRYATTQESDAYAARVNGESISQQAVNESIRTGEVTIDLRERGLLPADIETPPTDKGVITTQLIRQELLTQESERRGLSCSDDEVAAEINRQRALAQPRYTIAAAIQSGLIDVQYLDTPEPERSPDASAVAELYWSHADTSAFFHRTCERGKLIQALDDPTPGTPFDAGDRNSAIETLINSLEQRAQIERASGY